MIQDYSARDVQKIVTYCLNWLYSKSVNHFEEAIFNIAVQNREARQSTMLTFRFGGETFKYENAEIRFPQTLVKELYPDMHAIMARRRKILVEEQAYANAAIVAACSRCDTASQLYQLLPVKLHEALANMQINREIEPPFEPLSEKVVNEFQEKHAVNLDMIAQRITRNLLGIIQ